MDINCTHRCAHQHEGKCHLTDITAFEFPTAAAPVACADCPYCTADLQAF